MEQSRRPYTCLLPLMIAFVTCYLSSEVVINRLISIAGGYITGGTFIYFLSPMITDVVTEVYGYKTTRQMIWYGIIAWLFFGLTVSICLHAPYPSFWAHKANAFQTALGPLFYSCVSSSFAVLTGQITNAMLISKWKILLRGKYFWLRSVSASLIGDSLTVIISILLIFGVHMTSGMLVRTLLPELIVMILFSAIGAVPALFLAKYVSRKDNLDHYDIGTNFNPFKMEISDLDIPPNEYRQPEH